MSEVLLTRRGGGSNYKNAYALISAEYPAGSVCTCTNGTKTLRAGNTYGVWMFAIPSAGKWTVSCTDGSKTTSRAVEITEQYQTKNVLLVYAMTLFDGGSDGVEWSVLAANPTASIDKTIRIVASHASNNVTSGVSTANPILLDGTYSTLNFTVDSVTGSRGGLSLSNAKALNVNSTGTKTASAVVFSKPAVGTVSLDISTVSQGDYYVAIASGGYSKCEVVISKVWLE